MNLFPISAGNKHFYVDKDGIIKNEELYKAIINGNIIDIENPDGQTYLVSVSSTAIKQSVEHLRFAGSPHRHLYCTTRHIDTT